MAKRFPIFQTGGERGDEIFGSFFAGKKKSKMRGNSGERIKLAKKFTYFPNLWRIYNLELKTNSEGQKIRRARKKLIYLLNFWSISNMGRGGGETISVCSACREKK